MTKSNEEIQKLVSSIKVSWWERIWLPGVVLLLFFFERYIEPDQAPFAATIALIFVIANITDRHNKIARALELFLTPGKPDNV